MKSMFFRLPTDKKVEFKIALAKAGMSQQQALEQFVLDFILKHICTEI